jgi:hypothetical protein
MAILDSIQIKIDFEAVRRRLRLKRDSEVNAVRNLIDTAQPLLEPKVLYKVCYIEEKFEDGVKVGGLLLRSEVLRKNLEKTGRIFPFVVTIGSKFGERLDSCTDLLEKFYLDTIGNVALNQIRMEVNNHLKSTYAIEKTAFMAPGSLPNWPIEQQKPLFELLGDVRTSIGVELSESLLMLPAKSVSGIYFPTETSFFSCQLCPRKRCDSRKAKYDEKKALEFGIKT